VEEAIRSENVDMSNEKSRDRDPRGLGRRNDSAESPKVPMKRVDRIG